MMETDDIIAETRGDATGVTLPIDGAALIAGGAAFLTRAFRAFGSIGPDNAVVAITAHRPVSGGNSGDKLSIDVAYATPDARLHQRLFVKFSRCLSDPMRDRRRHELEAEVRIAELSRNPAFPVAVSKAYFADCGAASGNGILITERIAFGEGTIEPARVKCRDYMLPDAIANYRAVVEALAKLAAAYQSGRLSPQVNVLFPFDAAQSRARFVFPFDEAGLRDRIAALADFAQRCPRLLPPEVTAPDFLRRLEDDACRFLAHQTQIREFLHADPRLIALGHWNGNLDNAWFWRDDAGGLQCGLLDWGMAGAMNVGYGLWGGMSASEPDMLLANVDALLDRFATMLATDGGAVLKVGDLRLHFDLSVALLGMALMMDAPATILSRLPDAAAAQGPRDPVVRADTVVDGFLHVFTNFLLLWRHRDFGSAIDRAVASHGVG